jgi:hypothetical protein
LVIEAFAQFRSKVKAIAIQSESKKTKGELLTECDRVRDQVLPPLGIKLEVTKLVNPFAQQAKQSHRTKGGDLTCGRGNNKLRGVQQLQTSSYRDELIPLYYKTH